MTVKMETVATAVAWKTGRYQVTVSDSRGVTIGDNNQITQHFT
ncbi:hypothetical protein ACIBAG_38870 [Streptomyces sp. NPDC051243]